MAESLQLRLELEPPLQLITEAQTREGTDERAAANNVLAANVRSRFIGLGWDPAGGASVGVADGGIVESWGGGMVNVAADSHSRIPCFRSAR